MAGVKTRFSPTASSHRLVAGTRCRIMDPHPADRPTPTEKEVTTTVSRTTAPNNLVLRDKHQHPLHIIHWQYNKADRADRLGLQIGVSETRGSLAMVGGSGWMRRRRASGGGGTLEEGWWRPGVDQRGCPRAKRRKYYICPIQTLARVALVQCTELGFNGQCCLVKMDLASMWLARSFD
jgi:hypothetical protein